MWICVRMPSSLWASSWSFCLPLGSWGCCLHCCIFISMSIAVAGKDLAPKARSNPFMLFQLARPTLVQRLTNSSAIYCIASVIICNLLSHTPFPFFGKKAPWPCEHLWWNRTMPKWSTACDWHSPGPSFPVFFFFFFLPNHSLMRCISIFRCRQLGLSSPGLVSGWIQCSDQRGKYSMGINWTAYQRTVGILIHAWVKIYTIVTDVLT